MSVARIVGFLASLLLIAASMAMNALFLAGHGKTTLTAALTKISADNGWGRFVFYTQVAKASAAQGTRDDTRIVTIAAGHVEFASS